MDDIPTPLAGERLFQLILAGSVFLDPFLAAHIGQTIPAERFNDPLLCSILSKAFEQMADGEHPDVAVMDEIFAGHSDYDARGGIDYLVGLIEVAEPVVLVFAAHQSQRIH